MMWPELHSIMMIVNPGTELNPTENKIHIGFNIEKIKIVV